MPGRRVYELRVQLVQGGEGTIRLVRNKFYSVGEIAQVLDVHPNTVWKWLKGEKLKAVTFGDGGEVRITGEAVYRFLKPYRPKSRRKE